LTGNAETGLLVIGMNSANISAAIIRSSIVGNLGGLTAVGLGGTALLDIESCLITNNGNGAPGVDVATFSGGNAAASISNCVITHNSIGFRIEGAGAIFSRGNNTIGGNGSNVGSLTPSPGQ